MTRQDAIERIVDSLHEAMLDDARWAETSALMDEVCGASGSILAVGSGSAPENAEIHLAKRYHRGEDRSEWLREYFRLYFLTDASIPRLMEPADSRMVCTADNFSEDERKTSRAYNEGSRRYGAT